MPVLAVVHHLQAPFLGHAGRALRDAGAELVEVHVRRGDALPTLNAVDGVVSLGGEQSAIDVAADPALAAEAAWLREAVDRGIPVLGVCLGAQLLANALGGRVGRLPRRLVRWDPLQVTEPDDPLFGALGAGARGLYWNEDGFEPPPSAVELAGRPPGGACAAFRVGRRAWGVQFHPDVDGPALESWYRDWPQALDEAGVTEADARAADAEHLGGQAAVADALFGAFARECAAAGAPVG